MENENKKKKIIIAIIILVAVLGAIYGGVTFYFTKHFLPNTTVNGINASGCSFADIGGQLDKKIENYTLSLKTSDGETEQIKGSDIQLKGSYEKSVQEAFMKQKPYLWIFNAWKQKKLIVPKVASYNKEVLNDSIKALKLSDSSKWIASQNATVSDIKTDGKYTVKKEVYGTVLNKAVFYKNVKKAITSLSDTLDLVKSGSYKKPKYTSDSPAVKKAVEKMDKYTNLKITYKLDDKKNLEIPEKQIRKFIFVSNDMEISVSREKIAEYVEKLAKKYNTSYTTRSFKTSTGSTVSIQGGAYGWRLNEEEETEALYNDVKAGQDVTRELNWLYKAANHSKKEWGGTYVEVSIAAQKMWFYHNGKLVVSSSCVTGNTSKGNGTHLGMFPLSYKARNATLKGDNYETPVKYWMPFNGNEGLHDAWWRGQFGGSIYKSAGSHGCVNLPPSVAQQIFPLISKGDPVIVY